MLKYFNTYQPTTVTNHPTYFINWYRVNSVKPCYIIRQLFLGPQSLRGTSSCSFRSLHFHSFVNLRNLSCFPMTERRMNVKSPKKGSRLGSDFWKYIYVLSVFVKILAKILLARISPDGEPWWDAFPTFWAAFPRGCRERRLSFLMAYTPFQFLYFFTAKDFQCVTLTSTTRRVLSSLCHFKLGLAFIVTLWLIYWFWSADVVDHFNASGLFFAFRECKTCIF